MLMKMVVNALSLVIARESILRIGHHWLNGDHMTTT
jgi:hypothetical protein